MGPSSKTDFWPILKLQIMEFGQKMFSEIDLFDFTRFFGLDFLNFLAHCVLASNGSNITSRLITFFPYIDMSFVKQPTQLVENQKQVMEDKSFPKCRLCNYRYFTRLDLCRHFVDFHLRQR